jgi:integrase
LLLLTAQRRDVVSEIAWSEINLEERMWVLPRHLAKNNETHQIHLSDAATNILNNLAEQRRTIEWCKNSDFVFPTPGGPAVSGFSWQESTRRGDA